MAHNIEGSRLNPLILEKQEDKIAKLKTSFSKIMMVKQDGQFQFNSPFIIVE